MSFLDEQEIGCPYCGERITVLIDPTDSDQQYIEDCQVCCRPIDFLYPKPKRAIYRCMCSQKMSDALALHPHFLDPIPDVFPLFFAKLFGFAFPKTNHTFARHRVVAIWCFAHRDNIAR